MCFGTSPCSDGADGDVESDGQLDSLDDSLDSIGCNSGTRNEVRLGALRDKAMEENRDSETGGLGFGLGIDAFSGAVDKSGGFAACRCLGR